MGTTFEDLEKNSAKKLTGIGVVIFLHVLVGLVLMTGLTKDIVKPSTEPVELVILQDIKPPEPEPPKEVPPEPPKMVEKVAQQPDPKPIEKAIPVQKTVATPVTKPTISTPTPVASSPSPSPSPTPTPTTAAPSPAPKPTGVTRGVSEGEAGCKAPSYPREAEMSGISGTVLISVFVDTNGKAQEVKVKRSTGDRTLDRAATKAYSLCTFKPAMKDGVAQSAWFDIPYEFVLE